MQELIFNTTLKTIIVKNDLNHSIYEYTDIVTVKFMEGFYEIIQELDELNDHGKNKRIPVLRLPISNTNMKIEK